MNEYGIDEETAEGINTDIIDIFGAYGKKKGCDINDSDGSEDSLNEDE